MFRVSHEILSSQEVDPCSCTWRKVFILDDGLTGDCSQVNVILKIIVKYLIFMLLLDGLSLLRFSAGLFLLRSAVAIIRHLASLLFAFLFRKRSNRLALLHEQFESLLYSQFLYVNKGTVLHRYSFY